jgi:hypothetical protein
MGWREKLARLTGKRPAVLPCKKGKGDLCVVVSRRDNPALGVPGCSVAVTGPSAGLGSTDGSGVAEFTARTPGAYQYKVSLPPSSDKKWKLVDIDGATAVGEGSVACGIVEAYPIGTLIVRVFDDQNPRNRVRAATNSSVAYLDANAPMEHVASDLYLTVPAGKVSVSVSPFQAAAYGAAGAKLVDVPQGGTGIAEFVLPVVNLVTPKVVPAAKELWFLRPEPPPAVAPTWPQLPEEPPIAVQLSLTETMPGKAYTGNGTLSYDLARIAVFRDAACTQPLPTGTSIPNGQLKAGLRVHLKGRERGEATLQLALAPSGNGLIVVEGPASATIPVKEANVVEPQIRLESKVVLWNRGLSAHQKDDKGVVETELFRADATKVELQVQQLGADAPYTLSGRFEAPNCDIFMDEACTKKHDPTQPISVSVMSKSPYPLWLRGKTKGQFDAKLTLTAASGPHIHVRGPATKKMGVVELKFELFQHDEAALVNETFDANKDTLDDYYTALRNKAIPDQKVMTDAQKVWPGRMLHETGDGSHGRAKLVLKARDASQWPPGTDDYTIHLNRVNKTGAVEVYDAETDGNKLPFPVPREGIKASALNADKTYWVEGIKACDDWRGVRLDLTVDRPEASPECELPAEAKRNADWARFTVVKIKSIKLDYTPEVGKPVAWDAAKRRFHINLKADPAGRKVKLDVELTAKLKDVPVHVMLAPQKDNGKGANWGVDLPVRWKWGTLDKKFKTDDRSEPDKLLHQLTRTDADGKASIELQLSQFGGDVFEPAAYITQDPHLAKYVKDHADDKLGKRKPVRASHTITVWRRFWYREVKVPGINNPALAGAVGQYERVRAFMDSGPELNVAKASIQGGPAVYKRFMIQALGGTGDALVISDLTRDSFFASYAASAERPVEMPILIGDAYLRHNLRTGGPAQSDATNLARIPRGNFPVDLALSCTGLSLLYIVKPCVNSASLVVSGTWKVYQLEPDNSRTLQRTGNWVDADITLESGRAGVNSVRVHFPSTAPTDVAWDPAKTRVDISGLVIRGARAILGMSTKVNGVSVNVAVFDPDEADDFQNTIVHELGHAFVQVPKGNPANAMAGIPAHPKQADEGFGNHCRVDTDKCVMYDSGPIVGSYNRFCDTCHPYLLAQDMTKLK